MTDGDNEKEKKSASSTENLIKSVWNFYREARISFKTHLKFPILISRFATDKNCTNVSCIMMTQFLCIIITTVLHSDDDGVNCLRNH